MQFYCEVMLRDGFTMVVEVGVVVKSMMTLEGVTTDIKNNSKVGILK